jgi:hypothetical protein
MKRKGKRPVRLWILAFLIILGAGTAAYFALLKADEEHEKGHALLVNETGASVNDRLQAPTETDPPTSPIPDRPLTPDEEPPEPAIPEFPAYDNTDDPSVEYACERIEEDVKDFFSYLDGEDYTRRLTVNGDPDSWSSFTRILAKLSQKPPIPAGEGMDPALMIRNIYHLYRALDDREILLTKAVIQHEADTLEMNLNIIYQWLTNEGRCPDPEWVRPSRDVLYRYAGFFMNTIGGRAYLFRRTTWLRLIISYYAVLIIHDAELKGINTYGIDILPMARQLREDIARRGGFHFQKTYLEQLGAVEAYYAGRR